MATIDYKEKYEKAVQAAMLAKQDTESAVTIGILEEIFPELKESEDEKKEDMIQSACEAFCQVRCKGNPPRSTCTSIGTCMKHDDFRKAIKKRGEQKPANKVEPKFKVGDWIVFNGLTLYIEEVVKGYYRTISKGGITNSYDWDIDNIARLWTIQDAKDGDVLSYVTDEEDLWIMIYWSLYEPYEGHVHYHALLVNDNFGDKGTCCICIDNLKPATKEQRDTLMKAMTDAGYTFDFEKKKLKKIEQKPEWSDEDINKIDTIIGYIASSAGEKLGVLLPCINWLKSLKDRVRPKQEWSEEDENHIDSLLERLKGLCRNEFIRTGFAVNEDEDWLKSLRPQNTWKPSDEQMNALRWVLNNIPYNKHKEEISGLLDQIKEL